ncbi:hypothetical protein [Mucilaginibacter aquatilis]|uniref:Uncharacterized protein n=1 Tax=Mucilaginibacter aquatilis TaxID=1517760 RepID=A0A6I4I809_9SPHI|nr:hypothetical protein [Mucilaginibacter aquatilis]MVN89599.1 hypothetical protein [Mucilaginibacter aquatilis]
MDNFFFINTDISVYLFCTKQRNTNLLIFTSYLLYFLQKQIKSIVMHIAYSSLTNFHTHSKRNRTRNEIDKVLKLRHKAYEAACIKHREEIAAIQKYLPGWQPAFEM